ncbi:MAG: nickel pincer cofactor biosynthesis protein LarB [Brevinematales bacterium]|nr:nickel pincer cofactor biosynthesis protein LarB [Brevinematales bacterium]
MDKEFLLSLLKEYKENKITEKEILDKLRDLPFQDLNFAKIDTHRSLRTGFPEFILCEGKTTEHILSIFKKFMESSKSVIGTRANEEVYKALKKEIRNIIYYKEARIISTKQISIDKTDSFIAVITGGTSDIEVAEEAAIICELMGNKVERFYDIGVAGIHRLFDKLKLIQKAKVIIAIAGMEGALASVIAGLVSSPVIAVPTSKGYGANFGGLSALLTMLNSCAPGVSVVNIDNGFGAGYLASMINRL